MSRATATFWQECDRYHDLAEQFERNVELAHPGSITGRHAWCPSDDYCCGNCITRITYYEYRGPSI